MPTKYTIAYKSSVEKDLRKVSQVRRKAIVAKILALATNPRPPGVTKLSGSIDLYRLRVGDYRIIYQIIDLKVIITVIKIGHRKEVYLG